jgi:hypothetical protein
MRLSLSLTLVSILATAGEARLALRNNDNADNSWEWGAQDGNNCYTRECSCCGVWSLT